MTKLPLSTKLVLIRQLLPSLPCVTMLQRKAEIWNWMMGIICPVRMVPSKRSPHVQEVYRSMNTIRLNESIQMMDSMIVMMVLDNRTKNKTRRMLNHLIILSKMTILRIRAKIPVLKKVHMHQVGNRNMLQRYLSVFIPITW
jgi:hypothetical protein